LRIREAGRICRRETLRRRTTTRAPASLQRRFCSGSVLDSAGEENAMSMTGLDVFDRTIHKTNTWLKDLMEIMGWDSRRGAYSAMRATLHALRDRMPAVEVAQLGAQLPMLIRGFYYEGWSPTGKPIKERHEEHFLAWIAQELRSNDFADLIDAERIARGVFQVLSMRVTDGEIEDVKHLLPKDLRHLWP
jgi:uncharacterized protein (DUF2267 family)